MHNRLPDSIVDLFRQLMDYNVTWGVGWGAFTQPTFPGECILVIGPTTPEESGGTDWPSNLVVSVIQTQDGCKVEGLEEAEKALAKAKAGLDEYPDDTDWANEVGVLELALQILNLGVEDKKESDVPCSQIA